VLSTVIVLPFVARNETPAGTPVFVLPGQPHDSSAAHSADPPAAQKAGTLGGAVVGGGVVGGGVVGDVFGVVFGVVVGEVVGEVFGGEVGVVVGDVVGVVVGGAGGSTTVTRPRSACRSESTPIGPATNRSEATPLGAASTVALPAANVKQHTLATRRKRRGGRAAVERIRR
jgi:hypothetical protein